MVRLTVIIVAIGLFCLTGLSAAAKEKPQTLGQPLFCHGCVAVLKELHKVLKDSSGRKRIVQEKLNNLCDVQKFVSYTFSPPKMIKACDFIVGNYKNELIDNLVEYYKKFKTRDNLKLQEKFCDHVIRACEGVRRPVTDEEMTPRGLNMEQANQKIQEMSGAGAENPSLEPPPEYTTASSKDEL